MKRFANCLAIALMSATALLVGACGTEVQGPSDIAPLVSKGGDQAATVRAASPPGGGVGGGIADNGPHYNLNIIGVSHDKTVPTMTGSNRHVVFVPLQSGGDIARQVKISYVAGDDFQVLDGNATDDNQATIMVPSEPLGETCYNVWATALGKPNGNAVVQAQCLLEDLVDPDTGLVDPVACTDALLLGGFTAERKKGTPKPVNISDIFRATGCIDVNLSGACDAGDLQFDNAWIFNIPQLLEYFWDYDNNGLKLLQVRFYETTCGSFTTRP